MPKYRYNVSAPSLSPQDRSAVHEVLLSGQITQSKEVERFEDALSRTFERPAVVCSSGTSALHLALLALGVTEGDEVIVPDLTFVASVNAVKYVGATPVLVDVDRDTWNMSNHAIRDAVTKRTKAIIAVHLYGNPMHCRLLMQLSAELNIPVIEDAAQGLGGTYGGSRLGTFGDLATFSFYGNKVVTTGEGGCVLARDERLIERIKLFRGQGMAERRYYHPVVGYNYRMTDLQAAIGYSQMGRLHGMLSQRERIVQEYEARLRPFKFQFQLPGGKRAPWLATALVPEGVSRDHLAGDLAGYGIETRPVFIPMHQMPMYRQDDSKFPVSTELASRGISFPTHPGLRIPDIVNICDVTMECMEMQRSASRTH